MKYLYVIVVVSSMANTGMSSPIPIGSPSNAIVDRTVELKDLAASATRGLSELGQRIDREEVVAPVIPSQWHLENRSESDLIATYAAARHLGSAILTQVDAELSQGTLELAPKLATERIAVLLTVAEWLARADGYGNATLWMRLRDVALTKLGFLVADLAADPTEAEQLLERMVTTRLPTSFRARALNVDLGDRVFPDGPGVTDSDLESVWQIRRARYARAKTPSPSSGGGASLTKLGGPLLDMHSEGVALAEKLGLDEGRPDSVDQLLVDDPLCGVPRTTRSCWDVAFHKRLFSMGAEATLLRGVKSLLIFRKVVKRFPTSPSVRWSRTDSQVKQAFDEAWNTMVTVEDLARLGLKPLTTSCRDAAPVYEAILNGTWHDRDNDPMRNGIVELRIRAEEARARAATAHGKRLEAQQ